ncbi:ATP-dependent 3'-5' DNA helicase [Coemansia sp. RSA 2706]|nr:ATP-dependent 3'-5' DNA helicase [Coemansia sp. RSA 2706]
MDVVPLRRVFRAFAAIAVFLQSKSDTPLDYAVVAAAVRQSAGCPMSVDDLAAIRGLLGPDTLDMFWDPDDDHMRLLLRLDLDKSLRRPTKRARTGASSPVTLITGLIDAFDRAVAGIAATQVSATLAQLARTHAPPRPDCAPTAAEPLSITIDELVDSLQSSSLPGCGGQLVDMATRHITAEPATYQDTQHAIDATIYAALAAQRQIARLYAHQAEAIDHILDGHSVVVSTSTASGKSLIYQIPIAQRLLANQQAKFLLLFPTKALAQDQARSLQGLLAAIPRLAHIQVRTLDGDTPRARDTDDRNHIRQTASVILTNPDTLHASLLPNHSSWHAFLTQLELVVIDELHVYQGQFGQHVAHVLARLLRFAAPRFVACSATTSNPREHLQSLCHDPHVHVVTRDGAPHGPRHLLLWDTASCPSHQLFSDITLLAAHILRGGLRAIVFCKYRQACELTLREIYDYLDAQNDLAESARTRVMSYRGGYSADERRQIERDLFAGQLQLVVATSALELGIDVGSLDASIMVGTPPGSAALWQQAGRAGRQSQPALALVVAGRSPLDRQTVKACTSLFDRTFPAAHIAREPAIAAAHLHCAAFELPLSAEHDTEFAQRLHTDLAQPDTVPLPWDAATNRWCCALAFKPWPPLKVPIRSTTSSDDRDWQVILAPARDHPARVLEEMDCMRALFTLYRGGILMHRARTFAIDEVDQDTRTALVFQTAVTWFTRQRDYVDAIPSHVERAVPLADRTQLCYGALEIRATVFGYTRIDTRTKRVLERVEQRPSTLTTDTRGLWIDVPLDVGQALAAADHDVEASIHGAAHALWRAVAARASCLASELASECKSPLATRAKHPRLVVYERAPVSAGPTLRVLPHARSIVSSALDRRLRRLCAYDFLC